MSDKSERRRSAPRHATIAAINTAGAEARRKESAPARQDVAGVLHPLTWTLPVSRLPEDGLCGTRSATPNECAAIAAALDMPAVSRVDVHHTLREIAGSRGELWLSGYVEADVVQTDPLTLDPVPARLREDFAYRIVPQMAAVETGALGSSGTESEELTILDIDDVAVLNNGAVPLGDVVYETLAVALDPYRHADQDETPDTFERAWTSDAPEAEHDSDHPFAALQKLKRDTDDNGT